MFFKKKKNKRGKGFGTPAQNLFLAFLLKCLLFSLCKKLFVFYAKNTPCRNNDWLSSLRSFRRKNSFLLVRYSCSNDALKINFYLKIKKIAYCSFIYINQYKILNSHYKKKFKNIISVWLVLTLWGLIIDLITLFIG